MRVESQSMCGSRLDSLSLRVKVTGSQEKRVIKSNDSQNALTDTSWL